MMEKFSQHDDVMELSTLRPRERILQTARGMFYHYGVRGVGIESITEAAGTNKMTLYRHFASKDDLIVECLQRAIEDGKRSWEKLEAKNPGDPKAQLAAWIAMGAECLETGSRGCELANTAVELGEGDHPAKRVIEAAKKSHRDGLIDLCRRAGLSQPDLAADMLVLLYEGARVSRQSEGAEGPSAHYKRMAEEIIASFSRRET